MIKGFIGVIYTLVGVIWISINNRISRVEADSRKIEEVKLHVSETYAKKSDLEDIKNDMRRIFEKLDDLKTTVLKCQGQNCGASK